MLQPSSQPTEKKSFFKRPRGIIIGALSAIVLTLAILSAVHYLISNQARTTFGQVILYDENTLIVTSDKHRGDFWNFTRSWLHKESNYVPDSKAIHILKRSGSNWKLEQEISKDKPIDGVRFDDSVLGFHIYNTYAEDDKLLLRHPDALYILKRDGSRWKLEQEISKDKPIADIDFHVVSGIFVTHTQLQGDTLVSHNIEDVIYILKRNGSNWELEREISKDKPIDGINSDTVVRNIQLQKDTLLLADSTGDAIYILKRDGSNWELEREISKDKPIDGIKFGDSGRRIYNIQIEGDILLFQDGDAIYILKRDGSNWELEREISKDKPIDGVDLDHDNDNCEITADLDRNHLAIQENKKIYILKRNGSNWELEWEISKDKPIDGVDFSFDNIDPNPFQRCPKGWRGLDLNGHTLVFTNGDETVLYILRRDNSLWGLERGIFDAL